MKIDIPDWLVWSVVVIIIACSCVLIGIRVGRKEVGFSAAPRNSGSTKKRRKKSKGEDLNPPLKPLQTTQKEISADAEEGSTFDEGETCRDAK